VAVWETCATPRDAAALPTDKTWQAAAQVVRAGYEPGDLIVFAPAWIDPMGRMQLGDLIPVDMAARMDGARFGRIWEISIRGAHAPETAGLAGTHRPAATRAVSALTVAAPATIASSLP